MATAGYIRGAFGLVVPFSKIDSTGNPDPSICNLWVIKPRCHLSPSLLLVTLCKGGYLPTPTGLTVSPSLSLGPVALIGGATQRLRDKKGGPTRTGGGRPEQSCTRFGSYRRTEPTKGTYRVLFVRHVAPIDHMYRPHARTARTRRIHSFPPTWSTYMAVKSAKRVSVIED